MDRVTKRINGLLKTAEKMEHSNSYIDQLSGRRIRRNLKMVTRILREEIVLCKDCEKCQMLRSRDLSLTLYFCKRYGLDVQPTGYCAWGKKEEKHDGNI